MSKRLIGIIIIFILILILLYILFSVNNDNSPIYYYEDIKDKLTTGDIILFSREIYDSVLDKILYDTRTKLLNSIYGHAGIILKINNVLYIIECCGYYQTGYAHANHLNNQKMGGVRIINLDTILKDYYKNYKGICAVKFISREIPNSVIMQNIIKYQNMIFEKGKNVCFLAVADLLISHKFAENISKKFSDKRMFCTEFLHSLLCDCGVLKKYPSKLFWPHCITQKIFDDLEIIKYSKPYKFTFINHT